MFFNGRSFRRALSAVAPQFLTKVGFQLIDTMNCYGLPVLPLRLPMKPYLAAALQMTSRPDLEKNLLEAEELIELAVRRGAELIGLPENFAFLGNEASKIEQAAVIAETAEKFIKTMAQRFQVTLLAGGFPVPGADDPRKVYNTALLVSPNGEELSRYHKAHLFDVNLPDGNTYQESSTVMSGRAYPPVVDLDKLGKLGLSICYDVRFPELYRYLSDQGADVLFVPAAFTAYTGKDHWQILLQARAIENTCYVIAPAQTGCHYERRYTHGHAMIIDPWGVILSDAGERPGMAIAEIHPQRLAQVRQQMPSLQHRVFW
jgi:predicted amidohydrolase